MGHDVVKIACSLASCACVLVASACGQCLREGASPRAKPVTATDAGPIRRVVLITIDGLKPEAYLHPDQQRLKVPTLRWLKQHGASSDGVMSVFPTLTYPSHTSIATGTNPSKHRIVANRSFDPLETDLDGWRWYAEEIAVPPLWQVAEEHGLATALIYWPVTVGAKAHWRVPEYWRAKNRQDQRLHRALSTPGLLDEVAEQFPNFWARYTPPAVSDDVLTDIALHVLSTNEARLLFLHLVDVDTAQHKFGVDSPEAHAAIEKDDAQVARILQTLERSRFVKETAVVVASDHGFRAAPSAVRPCTLLTEAGFITEQAGKITDWKATVLAHAGEAYVYVKEPTDEGTRSRVREIFAAKQHDPQSGIARLYEPVEIRQLGGDPEAAFALGAAPGFQFEAGCRGPYRIESTYRATHGFEPRDADMRASLLMVGPSIPHGTIQGARLIDIAPTIAKWLSLPLPAAEGTPLQVIVEP
jgi:predicted AlkP superfamily pyrophosphatase or phosphodiesterase